MPNIVDIDPDIQIAVLVTFQWQTRDETTFVESTEFRRYAAFTSGITANGDLFLNCPMMEVGDIKITGDAEAHTLRIKLPKTKEPFNLVSDDEPLPQIEVTIEEVDVADPDGSQRAIWGGIALEVIENPDGEEDFLEVECANHFYGLRYKLGIIASCFCQWTFGDTNCCVDLAPLLNSVTIDAVSSDGFTIDVTGLSPDIGDRYYHRGYIERGGARIGIRDYTTPGKLVLERRLPASWLLATAIVVPGCDKTIETCRSRWANEEKFSGIGYVMPDYDPSTSGGPN